MAPPFLPVDDTNPADIGIVKRSVWSSLITMIIVVKLVNQVLLFVTALMPESSPKYLVEGTVDNALR